MVTRFLGLKPAIAMPISKSSKEYELESLDALGNPSLKTIGKDLKNKIY